MYYLTPRNVSLFQVKNAKTSRQNTPYLKAKYYQNLYAVLEHYSARLENPGCNFGR